MKQTIKRTNNTTIYFSGSAGGLAGICVGYPIDTIKTRMQVFQSETAQFNETFKTRFQYFKGLYKGLSSPLIGELASNFVLFGSFGLCKDWIRSYSRNEMGDKYSLWKESSATALSGAFAGLAISLVVSPTEMVKIQLQTASGAERNIAKKGVFHCVRHLWSTNGFFHGYYACLLHQLSFYSAYFLIYEECKKKFADFYLNKLGKSYEQNTFSLLMSGGIAGTLAWAFSYPTDTAQSIVRYDRNMNLRKMFRMYTIKDLYRGFCPTVLRAFPVNAVTFYAYEMTFKLCKMVEDKEF
jgi:solute carrier family 25 carnitine/acylcarnitine transporter 20/29